MHDAASQHIHPIACCDDRNMNYLYLNNKPSLGRQNGNLDKQATPSDNAGQKKNPLRERAESNSCEEVEETDE